MKGAATRAVFVRRLAMRVALNGAYRDVAILTLLAASGVMALAMVAGSFQAWPFHMHETPLVGNFVLFAWAAIFFVDLIYMRTLGRVERAMSVDPKPCDVKLQMAYLMPVSAAGKGASLFRLLGNNLPVTPDRVADTGVRRIHGLHNRVVLVSTISVLIVGLSMLALLPVWVLLVTGWGGLALSALLLLLARRTRNTV